MDNETAYKYLLAFVGKDENIFNSISVLNEFLYGLLLESGVYKPEEILQRYGDYVCANYELATVVAECNPPREER